MCILHGLGGVAVVVNLTGTHKRLDHFCISRTDVLTIFVVHFLRFDADVNLEAQK